jgi:hypothetical protein
MSSINESASVLEDMRGIRDLRARPSREPTKIPLALIK